MKADKLTQMRIKSKVEKQMMVTFNEEADDQEEVHDSGPKIVILEGIFTLDEVVSGQEDSFFEELENEILEKLEFEIQGLTKQPKL